MERMTEWDEFGNADIIALSDVMPEIYAELSFNETNDLTDALNRLAAYEDTGLDPEEIEKAMEDCADTVSKNQFAISDINEMGGIDHLRELAQAEKDGRLVVLPCKVGDKVLVDVRTLPYFYLHPADGCGDYAKCEIVSIVTTKKETYMKLRAMYPSRARRREYLRYGVTAIGKTIFLTREEAEAALRKMEEGEN